MLRAYAQFAKSRRRNARCCLAQPCFVLPCRGSSVGIKRPPIYRSGGATGGWVGHQIVCRVVSEGTLVMRVRSTQGGTDTRKLQLGHCHMRCMASGLGCTTLWKHGWPLLVCSGSSGLPRSTQAGGSTQCWLGLCLALLTVMSEGQVYAHIPCDVA